MKKKWYLIYTKRQCEKKVADKLTKKDIENYFPINRVVKYGGSKMKVLFEPLFPGFVFVNIDESQIQSVRNVPNVINFGYWLGNPAVIKEIEIDYLQHFVRQSSNILTSKIKVNNDESVRVNRENGFETSNSTKNIPVNKSNYKLSLPSLGYAIAGTIGNSSNNEINFSFQRLFKVAG